MNTQDQLKKVLNELKELIDKNNTEESCQIYQEKGFCCTNCPLEGKCRELRDTLNKIVWW